MDYVMYGWRAKVPELSVYFSRRDELSVDQNCLCLGDRVVIPQKLRSQILELLHEQHPGILKMKLLARSYVWFPNIDKAIEDLVASCFICQSTRNATVKAPLQPWGWPSRCWERIHVDFCKDTSDRLTCIDDGNYLMCVIDSHSKWLEIFQMKSISTQKTIERLRSLFASYGLPEQLVTDNGPQFVSEEFKSFTSSNGIKHVLTPPYHPASNGQIERSIQDVKKNLLRQVMSERQTGLTQTFQHRLDNFLFAYRNTPHCTTGVTPAELFLKRKPRSKLSLLKPSLQERVERQICKGKQIADRHRGTYKHFVEGEKVLVKTVRMEKVSWVPGVISKKISPVTYAVLVMGQSRFCHIEHLKKSHLEDTNESHDSDSGTSSTPHQPNVCPSSLRRTTRDIKKPQRLDL